MADLTNSDLAARITNLTGYITEMQIPFMNLNALAHEAKTVAEVIANTNKSFAPNYKRILGGKDMELYHLRQRYDHVCKQLNDVRAAMANPGDVHAEVDALFAPLEAIEVEDDHNSDDEPLPAAYRNNLAMAAAEIEKLVVLTQALSDDIVAALRSARETKAANKATTSKSPGKVTGKRARDEEDNTDYPVYRDAKVIEVNSAWEKFRTAFPANTEAVLGLNAAELNEFEEMANIFALTRPKAAGFHLITFIKAIKENRKRRDAARP